MILRYISEHAVAIDVDPSQSLVSDAANNKLSTTVLGNPYDCDIDDDDGEEEERKLKGPSLHFGLGTAHMRHGGNAVCLLDVAYSEPLAT